MRKILLGFLFSLLLLVSSCATNKHPGEVYIIRRQAEVQLAEGNRDADRGNIEDAFRFLNEAVRLALASDDPGLRIRTKLSRGNAFFTSDNREKAEEDWNSALAEARNEGNDELAAVCRIHINRGKLLSDKGTARAVRDEVGRDISQIKKDRFYIAFAWVVMGLAEKELGSFPSAEAAVRRSLEIHEKDKYLELAAYDWFMIASFRSLAGNYPGARQALDNAVSFDRKTENSRGLANDWRAIGDVEKKAGKRDLSNAAYQRAADIFHAIGDETAADDTRSRSESP